MRLAPQAWPSPPHAHRADSFMLNQPYPQSTRQRFAAVIVHLHVVPTNGPIPISIDRFEHASYSSLQSLCSGPPASFPPLSPSAVATTGSTTRQLSQQAAYFCVEAVGVEPGRQPSTKHLVVYLYQSSTAVGRKGLGLSDRCCTST